jgi:membrane-associated phospholipid phosphatase
MKRLRWIDRITLAYLLATVPVLCLAAARGPSPHIPVNLSPRACLVVGVVQLVLAGLVFALGRARPSRGSLSALLRDLYPLLLFAYLYNQTGLLNQAFFRGNFDRTLAAWDRALFGADISLDFCRHLPQLWFREAMHAFYFSYYFLVPVVALYYLLRCPRPRLRALVFGIALTFYAHYLAFIAFPAFGQQFVSRPPPGANEGVFFVPLARFFIAVGDRPGGAFPSSHVAVAVLLLLFAEKDARGLARVIFPFVLGLVFATVYVRAHYGVDVLAGMATGALCATAAERLIRREVENHADP